MIRTQRLEQFVPKCDISLYDVYPILLIFHPEPNYWNFKNIASTVYELCSKTKTIAGKILKSDKSVNKAESPFKSYSK